VDTYIFEKGSSRESGCRSAIGVQGQSPGRGSGGPSPPEDETNVKYFFKTFF